MRHADGRHVDDLQRHGTAGEVAARTGLQASDNAKQLSVELGCFVEIPDFDIDPEEARHICRHQFAALLRFGLRLLTKSHVLLHELSNTQQFSTWRTRAGLPVNSRS